MIEPATAAVVMIDMQNGFIDASSPLCIAGAAATVPACAQVLAAAREAGMPVFHVRRAYAADGSDVEAVRYRSWADGGRPLSAADPVSLESPAALEPAPGETVIEKPRFSAFFGTALDATLRRLGVRTVVLIGTTTPNCIRSTCYDALSIGYNVVIVDDATSSRSLEVQRANIEDMACIGAQIISSAAFRERGLADARDVEAETAASVARERA